MHRLWDDWFRLLTQLVVDGRMSPRWRHHQAHGQHHQSRYQFLRLGLHFHLFSHSLSVRIGFLRPICGGLIQWGLFIQSNWHWADVSGQLIANVTMWSPLRGNANTLTHSHTHTHTHTQGISHNTRLLLLLNISCIFVVNCRRSGVCFAVNYVYSLTGGEWHCNGE